MKKNIIMMIIILICSMSLLYVMYNIKTKDIYYVSENNNSNIELTMKLGNTEITSFSDLDSSKYYRIDIDNTSCNNTNTKLYWSNSTQKLKVSGVTTGLKCTIAFEEIKEDVNVVAIYINGEEQGGTFSFDSNTFYYLSSTSSCTNGGTLSWDNNTKKISISGLTGREYCTAKFLTKISGETEYHFLERMMRDTDNTIAEGTYTSIETISSTTPMGKIASNRQIMMYLASNQTLLNLIKNTTNYNNGAWDILVNSSVLTEREKYNNNLPFYAFKYDISVSNVIDGIYARIIGTSSNGCQGWFDVQKGAGAGMAAPCASNHVVAFGREPINISNYKMMIVSYYLYSDYSSVGVLTNTGILGLVNDYAQYTVDDYDISTTINNQLSTVSTVPLGEIVLNISNISGNYYFKTTLKHGTEVQYSTSVLTIAYIKFV